MEKNQRSVDKTAETQDKIDLYRRGEILYNKKETNQSSSQAIGAWPDVHGLFLFCKNLK